MTDDGVRVRALRCGVLSATAAAFVEGLPGDLDLQVWAFVVEHPRGTILFDTGMHPQLRTDPHARLGGLADLFRIDYGADDDVGSRLAATEIDPARVDRIVCSHLHFDHAGGNALVPDARVVVQRSEWEHVHAEENGGYVRADWDTGHDVELVDGPHDLFGDGLVQCVPTFGHTPGHQSLLVRTPNGELLLTADACYLRASLERLALPAFGWDLDLQREVMRNFAAREAAGTTLVFGHDPILSPTARTLLEG